MQSAREIQVMFGRVAPRYDFLNHVLCGAVDVWWRHVLARTVRRYRPSRLLDLATGSGDVLLALQAAGAAETYLGADFSVPMLVEAQKKGVGMLVAGDGLALPFRDGAFDAITNAFGFRNWTDRPRGLIEMARVLAPGGVFTCLSFPNRGACLGRYIISTCETFSRGWPGFLEPSPRITDISAIPSKRFPARLRWEK